MTNRQTKRMQQKMGVDPEQPRKGGATNRRPTPAPSKNRTSPMQFFNEVRSELRKVSWPSKQEVVNSTIIVLIAVIVMTTLIFCFDWVAGKFVLNLFG